MATEVHPRRYDRPPPTTLPSLCGVSDKPIVEVNKQKAWSTTVLLYSLTVLSVILGGVCYIQRGLLTHPPKPRPCVAPNNINGKAVLLDIADGSVLTYNPYRTSDTGWSDTKSDDDWLKEEGQPYIERLGYQLCPRKQDIPEQ